MMDSDGVRFLDVSSLLQEEGEEEQFFSATAPALFCSYIKLNCHQ